MAKIDWHGNDGRSNPDPGTVAAVECGVCGENMEVKRDVFGPTSYAEAASGGGHRHDSFTCPNLRENWHKRVCQLKADVYFAEINQAPDFEEKKKTAEKEIARILETRAAR